MNSEAARLRWGGGLLILWVGLLPQVGFSGQNVPGDLDAGVVAVQSRTIATRLSAYARVEPIALLKLNAAQAGIVSGITVLPGETVKAGTVLGHMTGPAVNGLMAQRRSSVEAADAALTAAEKTLAIARQKEAAHLSTQQAVYHAKADLAKARAALENARSQLQSARDSIVLKASVEGTVLTVNAAEGEQVQAGQRILTLQPKNGLWLMARYYGSDALAVRIGMTGQFEPAQGGAAIPVRVRSVIGPVGPDGGQAVGLFATVPAPPWRNGEAGRLTLSGAKETFVAVPTRALILDQGRWWVLVRRENGNQRREVVPGPSEGTSTLIKKGLEPGARVVVENAYLEFHRDVSRRYQPPD
jgi:membrane fusion protein, heavy metal efflux system